jgi:hypothetical protein
MMSNDRKPQPRKWVPDIETIADELVEDYSQPRWPVEWCDGDAVFTMESWAATAQRHGETFTEDDWIALVQELAKRGQIAAY